MKVFISQPMNGLTDEEIKVTREKIISGLEEDVEIIDSFFEGAPTQAAPLWYLGESIKLMEQADVAVFAKGWEKNRGCRVENLVAKLYGILLDYED